MIEQEKKKKRSYSYIKNNSIKNSRKTFFAALLGASIMPVVEYFFFQTTFNIYLQIIMALLVATGVTVIFVGFRYIFKK